MENWESDFNFISVYPVIAISNEMNYMTT